MKILKCLTIDCWECRTYTFVKSISDHYVIKSPKFGNIGFTEEGIPILPVDWDEEEWSL